MKIVNDSSAGLNGVYTLKVKGPKREEVCLDGCIYIKEGEPGNEYCFKRSTKVEYSNVACKANLSENPNRQSIDMQSSSERLIADHRIAGDPSTAAKSESVTMNPAETSTSLDSTKTTTINAENITTSHVLPVEWCISAIAETGWETVLASSPICCFCPSCRQQPEVLAHCKMRLLSPIVKGEHVILSGY
jgi:hypothetical protein